MSKAAREPGSPEPNRIARWFYRLIDRTDTDPDPNRRAQTSHEDRLRRATRDLERAQVQLRRAEEDLAQIRIEALDQITGISTGLISPICRYCGHDRQKHPYGHVCTQCGNSRARCAAFKVQPADSIGV